MIYNAQDQQGQMQDQQAHLVLGQVQATSRRDINTAIVKIRLKETEKVHLS